MCEHSLDNVQKLGEPSSLNMSVTLSSLYNIQQQLCRVIVYLLIFVGLLIWATTLDEHVLFLKPIPSLCCCLAIG